VDIIDFWPPIVGAITALMTVQLIVTIAKARFTFGAARYVVVSKQVLPVSGRCRAVAERARTGAGQ